MGGDKGPLITIPAAIKAVEYLPHLNLILCGDQDVITKHLETHNSASHPQLSIFHCSESVSMDEKPAIALRTKKDSSMRKMLDLVSDGQADACVSAGNTGALFATAHFVLKTIPGVERPALISALPTNEDGRNVFMLDLGANVFCDASVLYQFAIMGAVLAEEVDGISNPRVALLNMGEEDIKGSDHIKLTGNLLKESQVVNYVGFVEGNDILTNKADVIVCDGFVGNVALKTCEGVARMLFKKLQLFLSKHVFARIVGKLLAPSIKKLFKSLNPDQYNGASLIGLRGIVVKSHGNANENAFFAAIMEAVKEVERQVPEKIQEKLEQSV
ncbi:phosphate:acyl-[acyl carrier protein] acyltransferase [Thalassotalea agarivorans]|uniref:Phosphate acyltransferase n=2 Tax=Thalassotalea agarivorans TaxID=349064 RepID=A0A1I0ETH2_THASX|nr:phosphate:acyl-[acyl carrier protein] acyltransferase [Thalassotalea agarivorans]